MAKSEAEILAQKKEILKAELGKNPKADAKTIAASAAWKRAFGEQAVAGRLLGNVKEELGIATAKLKPLSRKRGKSSGDVDTAGKLIESINFANTAVETYNFASLSDLSSFIEALDKIGSNFVLEAIGTMESKEFQAIDAKAFEAALKFLTK